MATKKTDTADTAVPAGYADAMREVESILSELDSPSIDVDLLATKVERAAFLVNWCNERISSAQLTVDTLVAGLQVDNDDDDDDDDDE